MIIICPLIVIYEAEIITLRAIALKLLERLKKRKRFRRDHNATSYSTETDVSFWYVLKDLPAEIITLRAIALKPMSARVLNALLGCRDHNATSYSTETLIQLVL